MLHLGNLLSLSICFLLVVGSGGSSSCSGSSSRSSISSCSGSSSRSRSSSRSSSRNSSGRNSRSGTRRVEAVVGPLLLRLLPTTGDKWHDTCWCLGLASLFFLKNLPQQKPPGLSESCWWRFRWRMFTPKPWGSVRRAEDATFDRTNLIVIPKKTNDFEIPAPRYGLGKRNLFKD